MVELALTLIGALAMAPQEAAATQPSTFALDNGVVRAIFVGEPHREHELQSLERLDLRRSVNFLTSNEQPHCSARWGILLRDRREPFTAGKYAWFFAGDPRFVVTREAVSGDGIRATATTLQFAAEDLDFDGARFRMIVTVRWSLAPQCDVLEGEFTLSVPGMARLPFYVSQVTAPGLFVRHFSDPTHVHQLVVPSQGGLLFENPVSSPRFPRTLGGKGDQKGWVAPWLQIPLLAYYDEATRDCLYFTDDDVTGRFRDYEVVRHADARAGGPYLELRCRHLPDDLYARERWTIPCRARLALLAADWVDVAQTYRRFLADPANHAAFYKGPIGGRDDVAPEMKELALHSYVSTLTPADDLDLLARDALETNRLGGGGALAIWSAGFFPDQFEQFYFRGWLPGRPSLVAAVHEAQAQAGALVAPYVNTCAGVDYVEAKVAEPTPLMRSIRAGAVITEAGQRFMSTLGPIRADGECNADRDWSKIFVDNVVDIVRFTGAKAIYLDAFTTAPCFAGPDSIAPHRDHAPGGGNYMHQCRIEQLRSIRRALADSATPFAGFAMEGHCLWYVGDVDLMHVRPTLLSVTDGVDARGNPALVENARTIPFFRMVADSVKISQFENDKADSLGRRAWLNALDVFAFGMVPHVSNDHVDVTASYGEPQSRADAPFERYFRRMVGCLRNGFLKFHNGTLERCPRRDADRSGSNDQLRADDAGRKSPRNLPWSTDRLVAGMYRAPGRDGELGFVVTNPWIEDDSSAAIPLETRIDLKEYAITPAAAGYHVALHDDTGKTLQTWARGNGETFSISTPVPPGAIWYWVFSY